MFPAAGCPSASPPGKNAQSASPDAASMWIRPFAAPARAQCGREGLIVQTTLHPRFLLLEATAVAVIAALLMLHQPTSAQSSEPPAKPTGLTNTASHNSVNLRWQETNVDLYVEDASGSALHSPKNAGTAVERIRETLMDGTYHVRVEAGESSYVFRYGVIAPDEDEVEWLARERWTVAQSQPYHVEAGRLCTYSCLTCYELIA